jgi:hypothetical protein
MFQVYGAPVIEPPSQRQARTQAQAHRRRSRERNRISPMTHTFHVRTAPFRRTVNANVRHRLCRFFSTPYGKQHRGETGG